MATFNILHGRSPADDRVVPDRLVAAVRELDPDILALQEVDRDQPRSGLADLTAVAAQAMGAVAHRFVAAIAGTPGATWAAATGGEAPGTAAYGIALLSRFPVLDWQAFRLPRIPFRFPLYLREPAKAIIVHEEPRAVMVGHIDAPGGAIHVVNTHLSFVPGWNRWQLRQLGRNVAHLPGPLLLAGDFNLGPDAVQRTTGFHSLAHQLTFPLADPDRQLDHLLFRGDPPRVRRSAAPRLGVSDHRALVVDLDVPGGADRVRGVE